MTSTLNFQPLTLPAELDGLRRNVRAFIAEHRDNWSGWGMAHSWTGFDRDFSRALGRQGWIGMTWPKRYGGHECSSLERYVVIEELLAAGAPLGAHWIGDRQSGPLILRLGHEAMRQRFLPLIASGEVSFCIGLSEPEAGSDLASVRSRAERVPGGWRLNGRKIWTTNAHDSQFMIGLFRSGGSAEEEKHRGLSQFLIDLSLPGIEIRPIADLSGEAHFNEVVFDQVFIGEDMLVGQVGDGWAQTTSELAFERSQPDRYMSTYPALPLAIDALNRQGLDDRLSKRRIGASLAEFAVLREMSLSVSGQLAAGHAPNQEAALVKDLGCEFEQRLPETLRELLDLPAIRDPEQRFSDMLAYYTYQSPSISLRGGTRQIMRGIIAKGAGL